MTAASFDFATAGRIVVGAGRAAELPSLVAAAGGRAFVCTGANAVRHGELLDSLGAPTTTFAVTAEPTLDDARAAVRVARDFAADVVVGIGGGSVLDLGKAVAMLLGNGGDPLEYLEVIGAGQPIRRPSLPYIAVPTTAGTGAEVTANAVLGVPEQRLKTSLRSPSMLPTAAVVDPLLTLGCPPAVTASSGLDALTQCLEPFVSSKATPLSDAVAREGLRRASAGLRRAYADGADVAARTDMALCGLLGGMALANAKLGVVHALAGVIGAMVGAPHGAVCAALLAAGCEANVSALRQREPANPALPRYDETARLLTGRADARSEDGVAWISETVALLGVPSLGAIGAQPADADEIVTKAYRANSMAGNPIVLTPDELHGVLAASA